MVEENDEEMYHALVLGINSADLDFWAREIITTRAEVYKRQIALEKEQNKNRGFFGRLWGGGKSQEQSEAEKAAQLADIEREIQEAQSKREAVKGNQIGRKDVPDLTFNLKLDQINLTLVNDLREYKGVTLFSRDFAIQMNQYDGTNKYNAYASKMTVDLKDYGLWVVQKNQQSGQIDQSPFI